METARDIVTIIIGSVLFLLMNKKSSNLKSMV
jgi:hypothetical protein